VATFSHEQVFSLFCNKSDKQQNSLWKISNSVNNQPIVFIYEPLPQGVTGKMLDGWMTTRTKW